MKKVFRHCVGALLVSSAVLAVADSSPVDAALNYPNAQDGKLPVCVTDDDEFCLEKFEFTPENGSMRQIPDPSPATPRFGPDLDPSVDVYLPRYRGPATPGEIMGFLPTGLSINFFDSVGSFYDPSQPGTINGLAKGLYRVVIRTGDFDPSYMLLTGDYANLAVTQGSDGYFTIDFSARPTPVAKVVAFSDQQGNIVDETMKNRCVANNWVDGCEANRALKGDILASFAMMKNAVARENVRGSWISSNASEIQMGEVNFAAGQIDMTAKGPHYVPTDFPTAGLTPEETAGGTRYLNPAFFETYVKYTTIAASLSLMTGQTVTAAQAKTLVTNQASGVLEGTVEELAAGASAATEVVRSLTFTPGEEGVRVNFNLTHYSAPNPTLKFKKAAVTGNTPATQTPATETPAATPPAAATPAATTPATVAPALSTTTKKLRNGATLKILTSASKGKTYSAKSIVSPSAGAKVQGVKSGSPTVCSAKKTSVKMLQAGTCKLMFAIVQKKKVATTPVKITVS